MAVATRKRTQTKFRCEGCVAIFNMEERGM